MRTATTGFTLIEVLVALVIVALGMTALMGALTSSASTVSYMRDRTFAEWVALNQIANLRLTLQQGQVPAAGTTTGDLSYAGRGWHWRQDVVATQVQGIMRIDLKVRPADIKAGDDDGWFVTVSGLAGDAVGTPTGSFPIWGGSLATGLPGSGTSPATTPTNQTSILGGSSGTGGLGSDSSDSLDSLGSPTPTPAPIPTPPPSQPDLGPGSQ
ncbi:MAG TPA: type II secretion system minor pseudopilin GspI [Steroidobacteraceae bacterium]